MASPLEASKQNSPELSNKLRIAEMSTWISKSLSFRQDSDKVSSKTRSNSPIRFQVNRHFKISISNGLGKTGNEEFVFRCSRDNQNAYRSENKNIFTTETCAKLIIFMYR